MKKIDIYKLHPLPWNVAYFGYDDWHPKSMPVVVDSNKEVVIRPPQYVNHPGLYDEQADEVAKLIVKAVNEYNV